MSMMKYRVIREHGAFAEGDIREADEADCRPSRRQVAGP
jgi:hypothetical protein